MSKKRKPTFFEEPEDSKKDDPSIPPGKSEELPANLQPQMSQSTDQMALMSQMMQTFQSMMSAGAMPQTWASSSPFQAVEVETEAVSHDIILPTTLEKGIVSQEGLRVHPLYNKLFFNQKKEPLNGIPKGCTITLTGPAYSGKTRSALEMIIRAVTQGVKTAYVVAEEGFSDKKDTGRNSLFSRFLHLAQTITDLSVDEFREKFDANYLIIPHQYHLGKTWGDFIRDYRYAIEELGCEFTIVDSINALDPSKLNTVDNLNSLKTYNHEQGITCVVIGQVKDSGQPQGGESLFHTSEVALHISTKSMTSKAEAEKWGSVYRESITLINARSKVCHSLKVPVKMIFNDQGLLRPDSFQIEDESIPEGFWD